MIDLTPMSLTAARRAMAAFANLRANNDNGPYCPCRHGHAGCSYRPYGPCIDETMRTLEAKDIDPEDIEPDGTTRDHPCPCSCAYNCDIEEDL